MTDKIQNPPARVAIAAIPPANVLRRLAALKTATASELKELWLALFGKEPPQFSRSYLESRLA